MTYKNYDSSAGLALRIIFAGLICITCAEAERSTTLVGRMETAMRDLFYDKTTVTPTGSQVKEPVSQSNLLAPQKGGQVLVIGRSSDASISPAFVQKVVQQFISKVSNAGTKYVTIEDLTGTAKESLQNKAKEGGVQDFANSQQSLQFAASQGIPAVLTISVESLNVRPAQTAAGMFLGNARGSASQISNADGARSQNAGGEASARSFNEQQIQDKLIQQLSANLALQVSSWQPPAPAEAIASTCEVHAKVEGLSMPSFVMTNDVPTFNNQSVPVFASGANVEIDGILVGQTPCAIQAGRGMHELKITKDGLKTYSAMVNLTGQNRYDVTLVPTDETLLKFNSQMAYIRKLDAAQKINEADVKVLEGYAKLLRQSGYRIDQRLVKDWGHLSVDQQDPANKK